MNNKTFNAQESIRLIEQTLRRSGQRLEKKCIIPMLVWGYTTVAVSLLIYFLQPAMSYHAHWLWLLIPLLGYPLSYVLDKSSIEPNTRAFPERFVETLWAVAGGSVGIACGTLGLRAGGSVSGEIYFALVIMVMSIAMLVTGISLNIKAYKWGSFAGYIYLLRLIVERAEFSSNEILYFGATFFVMMCCTGHYLQYKHREAKSTNKAIYE